MVAEGVFFGLLAMFGYGLADFIAKKTVTHLGDYRALFWSQLLGLIPVLLLFVFIAEIPIFSLQIVGFILFTASLSTLAWILFFKGLKYGKASTVVPIIGSWPVVTTVLAILILKEFLPTLQLLAVILLFLGLFFISTEFQKLSITRKAAGSLIALFAMLGFGLSGFFSDFVVAGVGPYFTMISVWLIRFLILTSYFTVTNTNLKKPSTNMLLPVFLVGLFEVIGVYAFYLGIDVGFLSIVSPLTASYVIIPVILSYIFYKERIRLNQKFGVGLILVGLILLGLIGVSIV